MSYFVLYRVHILRMRHSNRFKAIRKQDRRRIAQLFVEKKKQKNKQTIVSLALSEGKLSKAAYRMVDYAKI